MLLRVGPLGDRPRGFRLAAVRFLEPVDGNSTTTVGLRWEATGSAAGLFPVLDANLTLTPDGGDRSQLTLIGTYRAPSGRLGAALDRVTLHQLADETVATMLADELVAAPRDPEVPAR